LLFVLGTRCFAQAYRSWSGEDKWLFSSPERCTFAALSSGWRLGASYLYISVICYQNINHFPQLLTSNCSQLALYIYHSSEATVCYELLHESRLKNCCMFFESFEVPETCLNVTSVSMLSDS
jgi:hypothetical protein